MRSEVLPTTIGLDGQGLVYTLGMPRPQLSSGSHENEGNIPRHGRQQPSRQRSQGPQSRSEFDHSWVWAGGAPPWGAYCIGCCIGCCIWAILKLLRRAYLEEEKRRHEGQVKDPLLRDFSNNKQTDKTERRLYSERTKNLEGEKDTTVKRTGRHQL